MNSRLFSFIKYFRASCFRYSVNRNSAVLGIETSCDDTGCAIIDSEGNILGQSLHSQQQVHIIHGGIIPPIAKELHEEHIERVVNEAIESSRLQIKDTNAVATTVKPRLPLSLVVGMKYGKKLAKESEKPFIPIHHMEAHALTIRMVEKVEFPFLVLLVSGGHCLLNLVQGVDKFLLLGQSLDDAPGEAFDKANNDIFLCYEEVEPDMVVPQMEDLCASFQYAITRHLCYRLQRCMECIDLWKLLPPDKEKILVVSGGVACNRFILNCLKQVSNETGYRLLAPPPHLCTDNGAMIAWNGMERWKAGIGIINPLSPELDEVDIQSRI